MPFWYFDTLPIVISKSNVVTPMDYPVVVLKSDACFPVEFLNGFVHITRDMACVSRNEINKVLVTRPWEGLHKEATILWNDNYNTACGVY